MSKRLQGWLTLLRAPNLLTVPGDPIAGFILAAVSTQSSVSASRAFFAAVASLLFYCGGMVHNDLCDLAEDSRDRPDRPLPSGTVSTRAAKVAMLGFIAAGILCSAMVGAAGVFFAVGLVGTIVLYNHITKHHLLLGPINMGVARGLSLMLGASAFGLAGISSSAVIFSAVMLVGYIAAVTAIAAGETHVQKLVTKRLLPLVVAICWLVGANIILQPFSIYVAGVVLVELMVIQRIWCATAQLRDKVSPQASQQAVGKLLHVLPAVQASLIASAAIVMSQAGWGVAALVLLSGWPAARILSRRFYAS